MVLLLLQINSVVFVCTWRGCTYHTNTCSAIEAHIRNTHLGPKKEGDSDHEEEFYYTEREVAARRRRPRSPTATCAARRTRTPSTSDSSSAHSGKDCSLLCRMGPPGLSAFP
ncbi:SLC2A4 regulator-like [Trichoplusia ni]|uniref:SLC2A4 regulator-like n=1 Tax=Trichoplusia ni TaxID=7111 RepID=A0A7E5WZY3_TRINI|nr:SLC2A4 regulator-like [Trichoplusia ni]